MGHRKRLYLNNIRNVRYSAAKLLREYWQNDAQLEETTGWWRVLNDLMRTLLMCHEKEVLGELERRVEEIERMIETGRVGR